MFQSILGRDTLLNVVGEQLGDEVLALVGDVGPASVREREFANADFFHDLLVSLAVEWRHA